MVILVSDPLTAERQMPGFHPPFLELLARFSYFDKIKAGL
jgi:hypothetical protein